MQATVLPKHGRQVALELCAVVIQLAELAQVAHHLHQLKSSGTQAVSGLQGGVGRGWGTGQGWIGGKVGDGVGGDRDRSRVGKEENGTGIGGVGADRSRQARGEKGEETILKAAVQSI